MHVYARTGDLQQRGSSGQTRLYIIVLVAEGLVVKVVFAVTRSNTLQVGDVPGELLDGLHLLAKEVGLNEVRHL